MNARIVKKKINHTLIAKMWLNSFIENGRAFLKFHELRETDELYYNSMVIMVNMMDFDLTQCHKAVNKYNIKRKLFIKVVNNLLEKYK